MATYELVISYKSGAQEIYTSLENGTGIVHLYKSDYSVMELNGLQGFNDFKEMIKFYSTVQENAWMNYKTLQEFCKNNILNVDKNTISNILIKDNYGNVYYDIPMETVIGIDAQGTSENTDILSFEIYIYLKGE